MAAVPHQPAIRALMPLYDDFDTQALIQPGGVPLRGFVQQWSDLVAALDRNDVCGVAGVHGWNCWKTRQLAAPGVQPVDADPHGSHLADLVRGCITTNDVAKSIGTTEYRDDSVRTPAGTLRFADISVYGLRPQIEASGLPMMVWCGWLDANSCDGTLEAGSHALESPDGGDRTWLSHGGDFDADPFATSHEPAVPPASEQYRMQADYFQRLLVKDPPDRIESSIQYTCTMKPMHVACDDGVAARRTDGQCGCISLPAVH